jgi:hypothetical protein
MASSLDSLSATVRFVHVDDYDNQAPFSVTKFIEIWTHFIPNVDEFFRITDYDKVSDHHYPKIEGYINARYFDYVKEIIYIVYRY